MGSCVPCGDSVFLVGILCSLWGPMFLSLCALPVLHCQWHGMEFCGYDRDNVIKIVRQFHTVLKKFQVGMESLEGGLPHLGYLEAAFHARDTFVWYPKEP